MRREGVHFGRALEFKVECHGKEKRKNKTWIKQTEQESMKIGLSREDVFCRSKWIVGVNPVVTRFRCIWLAALVGITVVFYTVVFLPS